MLGKLLRFQSSLYTDYRWEKNCLVKIVRYYITESLFSVVNKFFSFISLIYSEKMPILFCKYVASFLYLLISFDFRRSVSNIIFKTLLTVLGLRVKSSNVTSGMDIEVHGIDVSWQIHQDCLQSLKNKIQI